MQLKYAVSLWNYFHYADVPKLEDIIKLLRQQGYGVELWDSFKGEKDLFNEAGRKRLKPLLQGMQVSLHSAGVNTFDFHRKQIEAAADLGAEVIVLHADDVVSKDESGLDTELACKVVEYAAGHSIKLALENGRLSFLVDAVEKVDGLGICIDVGHIYFTSDSMAEYLNALKERIIHLHIQDILPEDESESGCAFKEHYIPGTGAIPSQDWELLITTLREIDFQGMAVFEIAPRNPLQTALLGKTFLEKLTES